MFYRLRIDLAFIDGSIPDRAKDDAKALLNRASVINQGLPNEERGYILLERCYHDETPVKPCQEIGRWLVPY